MSKNRITDSDKKSVIELEFLEKISNRLPDDIEVLQALAELYTKTGRFKEGLEVDLKLSKSMPSDDLVWYNLGCSYALTDDRDKAFEALTKAVDLGYDDYDWMKQDSDLIKLHGDPRFESLLSWLYSVCNDDE